MKSGILTTEFWITLLTSVVTLAIIGGWLSVDDAATVKDTGQALVESIAKAVESVALVVANATVVWKYISERSKLKKGT